MILEELIDLEDSEKERGILQKEIGSSNKIKFPNSITAISLFGVAVKVDAMLAYEA